MKKKFYAFYLIFILSICIVNAEQIVLPPLPVPNFDSVNSNAPVNSDPAPLTDSPNTASNLEPQNTVESSENNLNPASDVQSNSAPVQSSNRPVLPAFVESPASTVSSNSGSFIFFLMVGSLVFNIFLAIIVVFLYLKIHKLSQASINTQNNFSSNFGQNTQSQSNTNFNSNYNPNYNSQSNNSFQNSNSQSQYASSSSQTQLLQALRNYIQQNLNRGYNMDTIRRSLLSSGYTYQQIEQACTFSK